MSSSMCCLFIGSPRLMSLAVRRPSVSRCRQKPSMCFRLFAVRYASCPNLPNPADSADWRPRRPTRRRRKINSCSRQERHQRKQWSRLRSASQVPLNPEAIKVSCWFLYNSSCTLKVFNRFLDYKANYLKLLHLEDCQIAQKDCTINPNLQSMCNRTPIQKA